MDPYLPFGLPFNYYHGPERREHFAPQFGFRMPMMAPPLQAVDPRHVLESSMPEVVESGSEEIERELLEKEALDDEILSAAERQTRTGSGSSGECSAQASHNSSDDELFSTTSESVKSRKRTSTLEAKKEAAKKSSKKKARNSPGTDESTVLSFLERAQEG